ncbi:hypothetical protein HW555_003888 [Spodoptera exigua]|uniref:Uncharacterized protein n=1 Tax=Spodoptera exigua TaxID=7107 RepID=A0A835GMI0_SPOEX|nr:hypothetical protein HW555_003888 [Spodoptera exigua]
MSEEKIEVETFFGRCRCCLAYGYLKNMWLEHKYNGNSEIYGEMLAKCFALTWDHSEDSAEQDQICENCIIRLRDAHEFKKVILDSQDELTRMLEDENEITIKEERLDEKFLAEHPDDDEDNMSHTETEYISFNNDTMESIKEEAPDVEYTDVEYLEDEVANITAVGDSVMDEYNAIETGDSDSSQTYNPQPIQRKKRPRVFDTEEDESGKPKRKWPQKLPKSERHKTYKQYSEMDLRKCLEEVRSGALTPGDAAVQYNIPKKTICAKVKMNTTDLMNVSKKLKKKLLFVDVQWNDTAKGENKQKSKIIVQKFKENVRTLIKCTNATPIKGHWGIGYACLHCPYQTPDPPELKKHTLTTHFSNSEPIENVRYVSDMVLRVDVTDLKCEICDLRMDSLKDAMIHLKNNHDQPIHLDIPDHIIPFKFDNDFLQCALCSKQFDYFKHLSEHMTEHYPNYECADCGKHFINTRALRTHVIRHQKGVFVCAFCSKIFDTRIRMKEHERVLHMKGSKTRKCGYCDEKFMDTVRKNDHEVKIHGAPIPQFSCKACGKNFDSQRSLKSHINHFHLLLRPHKCPECGKGFYNKNEMKRHTVKHTKLKEYQCQICSKYYVTRSSLKSHMKIHDNQELFTCERCGDTFIQKKAWIQHVTKHADEAKSDMDAVDNAKYQDPKKEQTYQLIKEIKAILTFTNATPYKSKNIRYYCAYCSTDGPHFEDPDDLRTHTRTEHVSHRIEKIEYTMRPYWMNEVIKLDIDNLLCTVCCVVINNWNDMFKHLSVKHRVILDQAYTRVIPYVLRQDLKCALCKESFTNYLHLDAHMNAHYNNYVCDDCGDTFLAENRLKQHVKIHNVGKFPCKVCDKVFALLKYRRKHEELVHEQALKFKCQHCDERFAGEYLRHLHCLEKHREKIKIITCELCGETFTWKQYYTNHMRKKHENKKTYGCRECDKKFFSNYELKEHMLRHGGTKAFECGICHKKYFTINSFKQHAKKHKKEK